MTAHDPEYCARLQEEAFRQRLGSELYEDLERRSTMFTPELPDDKPMWVHPVERDINYWRQRLIEEEDESVRLHEEIERLKSVLRFYADPNTYFAIGFFPDPPCGDFMTDFGETEVGYKPGKMAREALKEAQDGSLQRSESPV